MRRQLFLFVLASLCTSSYAQVTINPGDNIQSKINANPAGTTFIINPGTYRITSALVPLTGDSFVGATACNPIANPGSCTAIISGSVSIGALATFDGTNYEVSGQTQQGSTAPTSDCISGYDGCIYPEDLWFDGVPYVHLYSSTLPAIAGGQWWFDYTNHIIYFHDNPSGHVVETGVAPHAFVGPANNVTIEYLTIDEFAAPIQSGGIYPQYNLTTDSLRQTEGDNWTIENSEIWGVHGNGISINYGMQILNNYIHNNGDLGVGGGIGVSSTVNGTASNVLIQGNTINSNDYAYVDPGFQAGGVKFGRTFGAVIRGNTITNNEGAGIHFDVSSWGGLVDGNTVSGNTDGTGITYEIGSTQSSNHPIFRNNTVIRNGAPSLVAEYPSYQISSATSPGVEAYCNTMVVANVNHEQGFVVNGASRGNDTYTPDLYYSATGDSFHHNTVIWDSGSTGSVGYTLSDTTNQSNFFSINTPPDYNTYHLSSTSTANFQYDDNDTGNNTRVTFANYQTAGADPHGTVDTIYSSGFPTVSITSPGDQSTFANLFTVVPSVSDPSGITKVEWYVDWNLAATATSAPYMFHWTNPVSATHTVAAMAYSGAGVRACWAVTLNMVGAADPGGLVF